MENKYDLHCHVGFYNERELLNCLKLQNIIILLIFFNDSISVRSCVIVYFLLLCKRACLL